LARLFAQPHDFHHLVLEQPRALVANPEVAFEFKCRNIRLVPSAKLLIS